MEQPEYTKTPRGLARQPDPAGEAEAPTESEVYSCCGQSQQTLRKQPNKKNGIVLIKKDGDCIILFSLRYF